MALKDLILAIAAVCPLVTAQEQVPLTSEPYLRSPPLLGYGTWNLKNATEGVSYAIQTGYRHIDAAAAYRNEKLTGAGIADGLKKAGIPRNNIWVTSKLWNDHHAPDLVAKGLDQTLSDLGLDYLDLYLMHWPVSSPPSTKSTEIYYLDTWAAMTKLLVTGKVRYIGVSNFSPSQLDNLINSTEVTPHAHQMELHPYLQQSSWIAYHKERGIHVTAYSPLGGTNPTYHKSAAESDDPVQLLENPVVNKIAKKKGASPAQVVLAWGLGRGTSVIPKSAHEERIEENWGAKDVGLSRAEVEAISALGAEKKRYNNPSDSWGVPLYEGLEGV